MLMEIFSEHNKQMVKLIENNEYAQGTLTHFETTYKHVESFFQWKCKRKDISINEVDYAFISDFEFYLKTEVCAHNTESGYSNEGSSGKRDPTILI